MTSPIPAPIVLVALPALFCVPADPVCWADAPDQRGGTPACGQPEQDDLGLCAQHRRQIFPPAQPVSPVEAEAGGEG